MNKVRYGIVGIGKMGGTHAKKLKQGLDQNGELAAVCDLSEERLAWAEQALPGVRRFADYRELLACGEVDAVVVATPHYDHPGIAMEALEAGKHVLIEKPAGVYTSAVRALNELARQKQGQVFGIGLCTTSAPTRFTGRRNESLTAANWASLSGSIG